MQPAIWSLFLLLGVQAVNSLFEPCKGKSLITEDCDFDSDCGQSGTYCHPTGRCQCHPAYEEETETNRRTGTTTRKCVKLPDKYNQACTNKCAEPLYCDNGRCGCKFSVRSGNTCLVVDNKRCSRHTDCTRPFTACLNQRCVCVKGTRQFGDQCVADKHCPLGGIPGGNCFRYSNNQQIYDNAAGQQTRFANNQTLMLDNCPSGQYCITAADSMSGHCCTATCPLQSSVVTKYSCEPHAQNKCPSDTHFCHRVSGANYAFSVCCKRPCQASGPQSVYISKRSRCVERGYLNGPCRQHDDCDGGATMRCAGRKCQCKDSSFRPKTDPFQHRLHNPSQQCERTCTKPGGSHDTVCVAISSRLGSACFAQHQCPSGAACYRGRCMCQCGYTQTTYRCEPPTTTTASTPRPGAPTQAPGLLGGVNGEQILGQLGSLLRGNTGGGGGGGLPGAPTQNPLESLFGGKEGIGSIFTRLLGGQADARAAAGRSGR